eukprot:3768000-Rhodomonas_salina.1
MIVRALVRRSNPTDFADEVMEYKAEALTRLQLEVCSMHLWSQRGLQAPGAELTLGSMWMHRVKPPTAERIGLCAPGSKLIRHFFLDVHAAREEYPFSWRQQNVPMRIGWFDATYKRGKALADDRIRQTGWSNDVGAPTISVMVQSASMDDQAFTMACDEYLETLDLRLWGT